MIITIFGKKGSGKTTLSKEIMVNLGGRVVFLSPVENVNFENTEIWDIADIEEKMEKMKPGEILVIKLAEVEAMEIVAMQAIYDGEGFTIIIDEIERYKMSSELSSLIHYSRHFKVNLVCNTRRYTDVPRLLTSQSDLLYVAQTHEPRDIQYLKDFMDPESVEAIKKLPQHTFLCYPEKTLRTTKNLNF